MSNITRGWKTSEFWLTLAAQVVSAAAASGVMTGDKTTQAIGLAGSILTALGYQVTRSSVKKKTTVKESAGRGDWGPMTPVKGRK